jgi:hypothetical protein
MGVSQIYYEKLGPNIEASAREIALYKSFLKKLDGTKQED